MNTGLDAVKIASKKVVHKSGEFLGNKFVHEVTKSDDDKTEKQKLAEEIIILPEKKRRNIKQIKKIIMKMEHYKISKLLNDSTVSKFVTRKWVEVNDSSSGQYSVNKNIRFETSILTSNLCDYSDVYIVVKGTITVEADGSDKKLDEKLSFE